MLDAALAAGVVKQEGAGDGELRLEAWEGRTEGELALEWQAPRVDLFARLGSTNDHARAAANAGAPTGTVVLADEQTAGRGRARRSWSSPAGLGLYLSLVARPVGSELGAYPLRIGLAVARALDGWTRLDPVRLKWPNDLLLADRKLGGILCEAAWAGTAATRMIVGIGLNLLHSEQDFPPDVRPYASSLRELGVPISRYEVASRVLEELRPLVHGGEDGSGDLTGELARRDALLGRNIAVVEPETGRAIATGRAAGIDREGCLAIDASHGRVTVRSGSVRLL